jgi:hypothetical protein
MPAGTYVSRKGGVTGQCVSGLACLTGGMPRKRT